MSALDHWHPIVLSRELGRRPLGVRLAGQQLVLFRTASGAVGALTDVCPHRRMRLSVGRVIGDRLQCCYHGWTFGCDGSGESPGTPKLRTRAASFETRDSHGLVWVKAVGSSASFPDFDGRDRGFVPMATLRHDVDAPLEVVVDNFTELEHTPTTHGMFGFPLERMHEVELEIEAGEDVVRQRYRGPCKTYPWLYRTFLGIGRAPTFTAEGDVRFSPVHSYGDYAWTDSRTGKPGWVNARNVHFFTPLDERTTRIFTLSYMRLNRPGFGWMLSFVRPIMRRAINTEVLQDKRVLDGLADKDPAIEGLKLGRFDRVLGLCRQRIRRIFRGEPDAWAP